MTMGASGLNYNDVIVQRYNLDRMHPGSPSPQFTVDKYDHPFCHLQCQSQYFNSVFSFIIQNSDVFKQL